MEHINHEDFYDYQSRSTDSPQSIQYGPVSPFRDTDVNSAPEISVLEVVRTGASKHSPEALQAAKNLLQQRRQEHAWEPHTPCHTCTTCATCGRANPGYAEGNNIELQPRNAQEQVDEWLSLQFLQDSLGGMERIQSGKYADYGSEAIHEIRRRRRARDTGPETYTPRDIGNLMSGARVVTVGDDPRWEQEEEYIAKCFLNITWRSAIEEEQAAEKTSRKDALDALYAAMLRVKSLGFWTEAPHGKTNGYRLWWGDYHVTTVPSTSMAWSWR